MTNRKFRVLHVIDTLDLRSGGPVQVILSTALHQSADVVSEVATLDPPDADFLVTFPIAVAAFGRRKSRGKFRYSPKLLGWLRENRARFDCIIVHGIWSYHALATWQALKDCTTPYFIYSHGMMDPWFRQAYPIKHLKKQIYWSLFLGRVLRGARAVLFTSEGEEKLAAKEFLGYRDYRKIVSSIGAPAPPEATPEQIAAFRAALPGLVERRHLLFLSRIDPKKGCDVLIEGFSRIADRDPNLDLVIAGPDSVGWRVELEVLASRLGVAGRIHWPGMLLGDVKWGAFRTAEAFVLPSHQENFGIAVVEALACSSPVIITRKINIWREIETCGGGIVCDDDTDSVADALSRFLARSTRDRAGMRQSARSGFERYFDVRENAARLTELLRSEVGTFH